MPMKTRLRISQPSTARTVTTWATISAALRLRSRPMRPVSQKVQPMRQPTWEEMHNDQVDCWPSSPRRIGMRTHSISKPSWVRSTALAVPPSA